MRAASTLTAIGTALWLLGSPPAHAIGFGRISNPTQLGQTLNFSAAIRLGADEALPRECVFADVFAGDRSLPASAVRVALDGAVESSDRTVRVTTTSPIEEPVVTVNVTLGCLSKVTRRFVAFVDPPFVNLAQAAPASPPAPRAEIAAPAPAPASTPAAEPKSSPVDASTVAADPAPSRPAARPREAAPRVARAPAPRSRPRAVVAKARPVTAAASNPDPTPRGATPAPVVAAAPPAATGGPRLQLEAAPLVVARRASQPEPGAADPQTPPPAVADAASAPKPDDAAEQLARERQRIQTLEEGLAALRSDARKTEKSLATLQLQLRQSEADRYANPLVYILAALSALLALAVAALWWRQSRSREAGTWWTGPAGHAAVAEATVAAPAEVEPAPIDAAATSVAAYAVSTVDDEDDTAAADAPITLPAEPPRDLTVEELIDLEQQAEFFVVLGQDEAAIDLLMTHVRDEGGNSPLPYLKLLEIHRRRGDSDAYEIIRTRFNRRFNAYAPDWDADLQRGRTLADYPAVTARLQTLWDTPSRVMDVLSGLLFRQDRSDETFDLPAYRELLFLYSIARDLAENAPAAPVAPAPRARVDILLPLDEVASPLNGVARGLDFGSSHTQTVPLDVDVSIGPELEAIRAAAPVAPAAPAYAGPAAAPLEPGFLHFDLDPLPADSAPPPKAH